MQKPNPSIKNKITIVINQIQWYQQINDQLINFEYKFSNFGQTQKVDFVLAVTRRRTTRKTTPNTRVLKQGLTFKIGNLG